MAEVVDEYIPMPGDQVIDIADLSSPHFDTIWDADVPNIVLKGGRGSTKSSIISMKLVAEFLEDPQANAIIMRKVANTIELSVYSQITWAIDMLGVRDEFKFQKSPQRIIHKETGTAFYFAGVDDASKLKSMIIDTGYVEWLWFEELAEFKNWEEVDKVRASFTRVKLPDGKRVTTYYSYNPPKNPYEWINEWINEKLGDARFLIDHSTYMDVMPGILADDYLDEIETVKENDPEYYRWMYLGEVIGLGTNVYNTAPIKPLKEFFDDDYIAYVFYGVDTGHSTSATANQQWVLTGKGRFVLMDTMYYSPAGRSVKKAPDELAKMIHDHTVDTYNALPNKAPIEKKTIDSAEGAIYNQIVKDYNQYYSRIAKTKKYVMIENTQTLIARGRVYYMDTENNKIWIEQMRQYRWKEETRETDDPQVVKENDHAVDAWQYVVNDNLQILGLIF